MENQWELYNSKSECIIDTYRVHNMYIHKDTPKGNHYVLVMDHFISGKDRIKYPYSCRFRIVKKSLGSYPIDYCPESYQIPDGLVDKCNQMNKEQEKSLRNFEDQEKKTIERLSKDYNNIDCFGAKLKVVETEWHDDEDNEDNFYFTMEFEGKNIASIGTNLKANYKPTSQLIIMSPKALRSIRNAMRDHLYRYLNQYIFNELLNDNERAFLIKIARIRIAELKEKIKINGRERQFDYEERKRLQKLNRHLTDHPTRSNKEYEELQQMKGIMGI